jgi:hypothetical protein
VVRYADGEETMSKRKPGKPASSGKASPARPTAGVTDQAAVPAPRRFSKETMAGWIAEDVAAAEKLSPSKSK